MRKCIKTLRSGKADGIHGIYSNHFIYGTQTLFILISLLLHSMFMHGYTADSMLHSVLISIPKDLRASLDSSENYRGIALCVALCKVLDQLIIIKYRSQMCTSDMQFAFKERLSTVVCTSILQETVHEYVRNRSPVYSCLLDASKAFDQVHFGKMLRY